jgi:ubiquinone/menaquinone biosynthesis C-methylase UbiE
VEAAASTCAGFAVSGDDMRTVNGAAVYRDKALAVALDPTHKLHLLPAVPFGSKKILDVGCHAGHILEALKLPSDCELSGCDIDQDALELARKALPRAKFTLGRAEALPYENNSFDFLFARSVMNVTNIPHALAEFNRVLVVGGKLWLSLHRWADSRLILSYNWPKSRLKTLALGAYLVGNSWLFHSTGSLVRYPLNRKRIMSFQTAGRMERELEKAWFGKVEVARGQYLVIEAEKIHHLNPRGFYAS